MLDAAQTPYAKDAQNQNDTLLHDKSAIPFLLASSSPAPPNSITTQILRELTSPQSAFWRWTTPDTRTSTQQTRGAQPIDTVLHVVGTLGAALLCLLGLAVAVRLALDLA